MLRTITLAATAILGLTLPAVASSPAVLHSQTFSFAAGANLQVRVHAGDVKIVKGSDSRHIVLHYSAERHGNDAASRVRTRFEVEGGQTEIDLRAPSGVNLTVEIDVPSPIDLTLRMLAGDVTMDGVQGNISLLDHVGDITIKPGPEKEYSLIQASTRIGDVDGLPGPVHGWLGKSGKVTGAGQYRLYAHVGVGDVRLTFD